MSFARRLLRVEWVAGESKFAVLEPTMEEVGAYAQRLADFYNEPTNRALLTNTHHFSAEDVVDQFSEMRATGDRPFLLMVDGALVGDCDLRNIERHTAEYAVMVGARALQSKGLGTRFGLMVMALAFDRLGLQRVYASVRPDNWGSLRMFEKLGYVVDARPAARRYAEAPDDVCVSISASAFRHVHANVVADLRIEVREVS